MTCGQVVSVLLGMMGAMGGFIALQAKWLRDAHRARDVLSDDVISDLRRALKKERR